MTWEQPLYGDIILEVANNTTGTVTWVDVSADVTFISASRGGTAAYPGVSETQVGVLNASLSDTAATIGVGYWVRLRNADGNLWAGYVQDIDTIVQFSDSVNNRKTIVTRLICVDWVGWASQVQVPYAGGLELVSGSNYRQIKNNYLVAARIAYLNAVADGPVDLSNSSTIQRNPYIVGAFKAFLPYYTSDTLYSGSLSDHLDMLSCAFQGWWQPTKTSPTTSRIPNNVIQITADFSLSTGLTFTDDNTGLNYVNIELTNSSSNVANYIEVSTEGLAGAIEADLNGVVDNGVQRIESSWVATDATSIGTYGERRAVVRTLLGYRPSLFTGSSIAIVNKIANPQLNDEVSGWSTLTANAQGVRTRPNAQVTPFANETGAGLYAFRTRVSTAVPSVSMGYAYKGEDLEVSAGLKYRFDMSFAAGDLSSALTQSQLQIVWKDANQATLSTSSSGNLALSTPRTWYRGGLLATAPANARFAELRWLFKRSDGANLTLGSHYWATAAMFYEIPTTGTPVATYFTGATPQTASNLYIWEGQPHASDSLMYINDLENLAAGILLDSATTSTQVRSIRWNASESLTSLDALDINRKLDIKYDGVTETYRIVGLNYEIDPERFMVDIQVKKV